MLEYGTTSEQLGAVAIACREHANLTPHAHDAVPGQMTMDDYLAVAHDLDAATRLYDFCSLESGRRLRVVVITSAERAKDLAKPPVLIRAVAEQATPPDRRSRQDAFPCRHPQRHDRPWRVARAGETLWKRAGVGPHEMDTAQLYDCFTISVILQLEAYGFCAKGEGGPFVSQRHVRSAKAARCRLNTGGGHPCLKATSTA